MTSSPVFKVGISPTLGIRGVIATRAIARGQVIERCPIILVPPHQIDLVDQTVLEPYTFAWDDENSALLLGYGMLLNHSYAPNVDYDPDYETKEMVFTALRDIEPGEELCINYNGRPENQTLVPGLEAH